MKVIWENMHNEDYVTKKIKVENKNDLGVLHFCSSSKKRKRRILTHITAALSEEPL